MDAKDSFVFFALLLLSLGLFGSLSLTYCVWNKQTDIQKELHNKLQSELQNELKNVFQAALNSRMHLGTKEPFQIKGQLKRNLRQVNEDTDMPSATEILTNALTEIIEMKLMSYVECNTDEYNQTNCTLRPGPKGEPGDTGPPGMRGMAGQSGERGLKGDMGSTGPKGDIGERGGKGDIGPRGMKGVVGQRGPLGLKGDTGPEGPKGTKGEPGDKGTKGNLGYPGYKGEKGMAGSTGVGLPGVGLPGVGLPGAPGVRGVVGLPGSIGPPGPPGMQGRAGLKGGRGQRGPTGDKGDMGGTGGWRRVVFLDMTDTSHICPTGLNLTSYSRRTCGRAHSGSVSCSPTTFSVGSSQYSGVCGRALGYRGVITMLFMDTTVTGQVLIVGMWMVCL